MGKAENSADQENDNWWDEGYDKEEAEKEQSSRSSGLPRRLWLPPEKGAEITFLTDKPLKIREHNLKLDGHWRNWHTCNRQKSCPLCRSNNTPYLAYMWLIIDHSVWNDRDGNEHKDEPRLFVAKARIAARYDRMREKKDGLRGCRVEIYRTDSDSANVGNEIEFMEKYDEKDLRRKSWYPKNKTTSKGTVIGVDWEVLDDNDEKNRVLASFLKPKSPEELKALVEGQRDEQDVEKAAEDGDFDEGGVRY